MTGVPLEYLSSARLAALKANTTHDVDSLMTSLAGNAWSGSAVLAVYIAALAELPAAVFMAASVDDETADDSGAEADAVGGGPQVCFGRAAGERQFIFPPAIGNLGSAVGVGKWKVQVSI